MKRFVIAALAIMLGGVIGCLAGGVISGALAGVDPFVVVIGGLSGMAGARFAVAGRYPDDVKDEVLMALGIGGAIGVVFFIVGLIAVIAGAGIGIGGAFVLGIAIGGPVSGGLIGGGLIGGVLGAIGRRGSA